MESSSASFTYTRGEILALKKNHQLANLPSHLYASDYLTSHGKFSPDKYVESMWKSERNRKPITRGDIPDILQNGSTLSPQRRGFSLGCRESVETDNDSFLRKRALNSAVGSTTYTGAQPRTGKLEKRFNLNPSSSNNNNNSQPWRKFPFFNNGESRDRFDGYSKSNGFPRRDSDSHNEALPEWMDDGPESSTDMIPLRGFNDSESELQQSLTANLKLNERNPGADLLESLVEHKMTLPASDAEFAAKFGILDVADIEAKMLSDQAHAPKASRLSRFFGYDGQPIEEEKLPPKVQESVNVLPAVARLLSGGTRSMRAMNSELSDNPIHTKPITEKPQHQASDLPSQSTPLYSSAVEALMQKSKNNIDLVPTAVMLQRSNLKEDSRHDYKSPTFNNPSSSPGNDSTEPTSYSPRLPPQSTSLIEQQQNMNMFPTMNCAPAIAQLGTHLFPVPNMIAVAMDSRQINEAYQSGNYSLMSALQSRLNAQMQVHAALPHFRNDASLLIVSAGDSRFEQQLAKFVDQQRLLDSTVSSKPSSVSMSRTSPVENKMVDIEEAFRTVALGGDVKRNSFPTSSMDYSISSGFRDSVNSMNFQQHHEKLAILEKLPSSARPMTVEELERKMMGH
ncbi:hypothetical protein M3Y94_00296800 [Aphelenchoides besseyi]|nr:hypothetical protein M3Y94_00296800 [Aphelenchoides besseyi]